MRLGRTSTAYAVRDTSAALLELDARTVGAELFADHERGLGSGVALDLGASAGGGAGDVYLLPRVRLAWRPAERWTVSAGWARFRQTEQSLRNPESLLGQIVPADLFIGSAASGVPEARADQLVGAADFQATSGLRVSAQVYERYSRGLLLVAPGAGDPFATAGFSSGSGTARGLALTASVRGARIGATASYGLQQVRLRDGDSSYVPTHATTHLLDAGVIAFPTPTLSIRLGAVAAAGRRTSATVGGLEWEACNLLDRGCELSGSPVTTGRPGGRRLPGYLRLDLGVRQHWHLRLGGRDASVAVFGTVTNVLGRRNILTYTADPVTGAASPVDMRPRAPLVVGLDWRL
ncbi:MAG TPA: hypothetical protein VFT84_06500, partial [Gemmatimonadales bacterium]|nr:hypothetical protein [Gemmatimonadales bacterium]